MTKQIKLSDTALKDVFKDAPNSATKKRFDFYGGYLEKSNMFMPINHLIQFQQEVYGSMNHYRGFKANMNPCDAWIYQEIIHETQPTIIIELGRQGGGSTLMLADMLKTCNDASDGFENPKGVVISIDLSPKVQFPLNEAIHQIQGDCLDLDVIEEVKRFGHRRIMVIDDCAHTKENVLANLNNYGPLVPEGCYYIIEDTILNHGIKHPAVPPGNDPMSALNEWLPDHPEFQVDRAREKFFITNNPKGFLLRMPGEDGDGI